MSRSIKVWHNPRCSKSRLALKYLEEKGCEIEVFEYLKTPPRRVDVEEVLGYLDMDAKALLRRKEAPFLELDLGSADTTVDQVLEAIVSNPILIERPIVIHGQKAVVARPTEKIDEIL